MCEKSREKCGIGFVCLPRLESVPCLLGGEIGRAGAQVYPDLGGRNGDPRSHSGTLKGGLIIDTSSHI